MRTREIERAAFQFSTFWPMSAAGVSTFLIAIAPELTTTSAAGFGPLQQSFIMISVIAFALAWALRRRSISISVRGLFRLAVAGFSVTITLVTMEVVARSTWRQLSSEQGVRNVDLLLGTKSASDLFNERPHPYLLWENTPSFIASNGIRQTNSRGYRNSKDYSDAPGSNVLRILTLGGSTTYGYLQDSPDTTWPCQLEQLLNNEPGNSEPSLSAEVINGGLNYATTAELLCHYIFRDRYLKPDVVLIHVGGNDAAPLLFDDYNPEYTHFRPGWTGAPHRLRSGEGFLLKHSGVAKLLYSRWLADAPAALFCDKQSKSLELAPEYYLENAKRNTPVGFERNLELLIRNITADGSRVVLFPFVLCNDSTFTQLKGLPAERAAYTLNSRAGVKIAIQKHREIMIRLSQKYQTGFVDVDPALILIEAWLDHCHLSEQGEKIKANAVLEALQKQKFFEKSLPDHGA
ncbi:MAG: SGNH/GDSL hydrolase family protein [Planctomycetaceae bacterium]